MIAIKALLTRSTLVYRFLSLILTGLNVLKVQSFTRIFVSYFGKVIHMGADGLNPPPPPNILSLKYSLLWELETSKQKFKTINILNFVHAWEKKHFSSAFTSSFQLVTYVRLSTCCYMLQHYVPCKQYVIIKISAVFHCLSVGYFRSSKR